MNRRYFLKLTGVIAIGMTAVTTTTTSATLLRQEEKRKKLAMAYGMSPKRWQNIERYCK